MRQPADYGICNILLVEDSAAEARLTREVLCDTGMANKLHHVKDGAVAMQFLRREGAFHDAPTPDLMILDLNLPRMDGREVLLEIRQTPEFRLIPVVVLTTSGEERDILGSYELLANCYITKPPSLDEFTHVLRTIEAFWLKIVQLPTSRHRFLSAADAA